MSKNDNSEDENSEGERDEEISNGGEDENSEEEGDEEIEQGSERDFNGFGDNDVKKRGRYWVHFSEMNIDGITYAKCDLCVDNIV